LFNIRCHVNATGGPGQRKHQLREETARRLDVTCELSPFPKGTTARILKAGTYHRIASCAGANLVRANSRRICRLNN
jgi:hypothetical protein